MTSSPGGATERPWNAALIVAAANSYDPSKLEAYRKALRRLSIVQCHQMAYGGGTVHVGWTCKSCNNDWARDEAEKHAPDCLATPKQPQ